MITKEKKTEVIGANATHDQDTGSPEVQIAILTERIRELTATTTTAVWACTRWSASAAACSTTWRRKTSSATARLLRSSASASDSDELHFPGTLKDMKVFMEGQVNRSLHFFCFLSCVNIIKGVMA